MTYSPEWQKRAEYHVMTNDELLSECSVVTDEIDRLIAISHYSDETENRIGLCISDKSEVLIERSFNYIQADQVLGWAWPLAEKRIHIEYVQSRNELTHESYKVTCDTFIHQQDVSKDPIRNVYNIEYFASRTSAVASVESLNFDSSKPNYTSRSVLPYDLYQLFGEVSELEKALDADTNRKHYEITAE